MSYQFPTTATPEEKQFQTDYSGGNQFFDQLFQMYNAPRPDYTGFQKAQNKSATAQSAAAAKRAASRNGGAEGQTQLNAQGDAEAGAMGQYAQTDAGINQSRYADIVKQLQGKFGAAQGGRSYNRNAAQTGQSYADRLNAMKQGVILGQDQLNNQALNGAISGLGNLSGGLINYFMKTPKTPDGGGGGGSDISNPFQPDENGYDPFRSK